MYTLNGYLIVSNNLKNRIFETRSIACYVSAQIQMLGRMLAF